MLFCHTHLGYNWARLVCHQLQQTPQLLKRICDNSCLPNILILCGFWFSFNWMMRKMRLPPFLLLKGVVIFSAVGTIFSQLKHTEKHTHKHKHIFKLYFWYFGLQVILTIWRSHDCIARYLKYTKASAVLMVCKNKNLFYILSQLLLHLKVTSTATLLPAVTVCPHFISAYNQVIF